MNTRLFRAFIAIGVLGAAVAIPVTEAMADTATVGSVRGQLRDKSTGEAAAGATVVATSPAMQGEQIVLADDAGLYFLTALPPGYYTLTVYYNDSTFERGNVLIQVGKEAVVNIAFEQTKAKGETIEIRGTAPVIDEGSTKTGVTITTDYTNNIPGGRTFGDVIGGASGSQADLYGTSISGSTSVENVYVVEGLNTTDTGRGLQSTNLPNEFVQETEVITGGYAAEYGRATGGIINVVTKQGSNQLHGSVFAYYTPGQLTATAKTIQTEGGSIDTANNLDYNYDVGAELGGPIIKDKLWFHIGFNPQRSRNVTTRFVQQQVDRNGDGIPDVDPTTGFTIHEPVSSQDIPQSSTTYFFTAKVNGEINQNHQFQLSLLGNPRVSDVPATNIASSAADDALLNVNDGAYDIAGKYTGKFNNGQTEVDALIGFHGAYSNSVPRGAVGNLATVQYNYSRSLYDFADIEGASAIAKCQDGGPQDLYPKIQNCPVSEYIEQGQGELEKRTNNRTSALVSVTQRVKGLGYHVLKAGIDVEIAGYDSTTYFTGNEFLKRSCNTDPATGQPDAVNCDNPNDLPGSWQISKFATILRNLTPAEIANPGMVMLQPGQQIDGCQNGLAICSPAGSRTVGTSNRSIGAYLQDSWQILPNFTFNAGLRYEQQVLNNAQALQGTVQPDGEVVPAVAFSLNNWAPRLGAIYDPTSEGKSKIFAHWGRFYENIPNDINVRSFGAEIDDVQVVNASQLQPNQPGYNPACNVDHAAKQNPAMVLAGCNDLAPASLLGGGNEFVAPGITGQYQDELVVGAEYEVLPDIKVGVTYTHRTMPSVIEDMSADGAQNYLIANPGNNYDSEAAQLDAQAQAAMARGNTGLAGVLSQQASALRFIKNFDKPSRNYDAGTLRVEQRPTKQSLLIASYTYSSERGNYPGLFSTETGQLDPNNTSQYDLPDLMANRYGPLGLDRPHNFKLDGFYQFDLKRAGLVTLGTSLRAQSGIVHNALGAHPIYGPGESFLLPRGAIARSPLTSSADIHLSYGRRLDKDVMLEAFVRVFNLFNQQDELDVDSNYTFDSAVPIVGGDMNDLKHIKTLTTDGRNIMQNSTPNLNPNFDHTDALTLPRSFEFGARLTF